MNMESVIGDQKVSRRRKPVRILRMNGDKRFHLDRFTLDRFNPGFSPAATADQRITRIKAEKPAETMIPDTTQEPGQGSGQGSARKANLPQSLLHHLKSWLHYSKAPQQGYRVLGFVLCSALAFLGIAAMPSYERPVNLSGFALPPADDMAVLLLHAVIDDTSVEEDSTVSLPLPLTLSLRTYTIARNDTLDAIARRFSVSLDTLISINGISDVRRLQVGTKLKVPNIDGISYTVNRGDSLSSIASRNNTTVLDIVDANDLASHTISPGQSLFIPGAKLSSYDLKKALGTLVIWPVTGRISSNFGYRSNPFTGIRQFHNGLDIVAPVNTHVKAAMDGRVAETGYSSIFGNFVIMTHAGSYQTLYAHLNRIDVRVGQVKSQGSTVGLLGSTGYSTGPHLHFGVFRSGNPTDPLKLLRGN
jgi:murein DD-endopeptidase MepM/ murein hydrolase activator NlpD